MIKLFKIFLSTLLIVAGSIFPQNKSIISLDYTYKKIPFGLTQKVIKQEPTVSLVLSGGGARSVSQIGILRAFVEKEIPINRIVGTSMGSILGGFYAAGYNIDALDSIASLIPWDEILKIKSSSNRKDLFVDQKITEDKALFVLRLEGLKPLLPTSVNTGELLSSYLNLLTLNAPIHTRSNFDELKTDFNAVCTDLITGKMVVLNKGSLSLAMRASSSISLLVAPVKMDTLLLADGGLVANIPVKVAKDLGSDFIIVLNTTSPLNTAKELAYPWNVADQIVSIPMQLLSIQQLQYADVVIAPDLGRKKNNDFTNLDSLVNAGYKAAQPMLNDIEQKIRLLFRKKIDEKEFYLKKVFYNENALPIERPFLLKYSHKDSVSNYEILDDIYTLFKSGDYDDVFVETQPVGEGTEVRFILRENTKIKNTLVDGISLFPKEQIDSILIDLQNQPYNAGKISKKLIVILNLYRKRGYSLAEVENIFFNKEEGSLEIKFSEGKISRIEVEGNKKTAFWVIRRELPFNAGELFSYQKVEKGLSNLRSINLFNDINLVVEKEGEENALHFIVDEKPSQLIRFGLRIDNENLTQVNVDVRDENFAKSGTELGLMFGGGLRNRSFILEHKANRIFDTYLTYKVRAFYEFNDVFVYKDDSSFSDRKFSRSENGEYRQIFKGFSIGLGAQVQRFGNLIFEGRYQWDEIKNKQDYKGDIYKKKLVSLLISSTIDSQDKYPFPGKGMLVKAFYETAQKLLGGDVSYTKFYFDYHGFLSLYDSHTIIPRLTIGVADNTLPLSQQFSLGGQNSFFGLRDYDYRGRQIFLTSLQYRYKLPFSVFFDSYISFRYDLGSVWTDRKEIRFKDLRHGAGATLSFDTPLGPADFSVGRSFLFKGNLSDRIKWGTAYFYFTIGYYY
ncbi:MAG: BamA/TamA family outer membrane protein [Ignavibacteriales bacterium]|nr:BamA/TamA family outer membrane protein [Ignavibacteriales bacterium]